MAQAWFRDDIGHLLQGIYIASVGLSADEQRGFNLAVAAIAVAVGIKLNDDFARDTQSPPRKIGGQDS